jgi:hypothetical protein
MHVRRILTLVAAVTSLIVVGVGASAASAATAHLSIESTGMFNQYEVTVEGTVGIDPPAGSYVAIRLWGDDPHIDDFIKGPLGAALVGRDFKRTFYVYGCELNEDWGEDEIYAGVRAYNANGRQFEQAETNRVHGHWG